MVNVTLNKRIALAPLTVSVEKEERNGFAVAKQKYALVQTEVVLADADGHFSPGQKVWVRGDIIINLFVKEIFEIDGKKFFFCPIDYIQIAEIH